MATTTIDRRAPSEELLVLVQQIHDNQMSMDAKLTTHMRDETHEIAEAIAKMMADSFPQGDPAGHRRYHEASIKAAEDKALFWGKMRFEITRWGLIGFLGWVVYALWQSFLQGPHK